ncbi:hypothetical protein QTL97_15595 [Sporosarcina thermotolerans]|uniref:Uncharacterized protein n=1 Tax=Sporosarcina thermotolerans TaxID=633404 RepID=A0AAW9ABN1_9BACL|nr:hypothetical protein [Sporosarcina thermotolerans]MDW0118355.1 hypothetical protein [Sporosarcina thermotolerans]WHT49409.1 hypothetical protein QNH10_07680 [Sporosarcina thermotolerans]
MERKYSKYSVILVVVGIFVAYMIFPPFNITFGKWSMVAIPIGFAIYLTGVILGINAFLKKEQGFLKYISIISIALGVLYVLFLFTIFGGEI